MKIIEMANKAGIYDKKFESIDDLMKYDKLV